MRCRAKEAPEPQTCKTTAAFNRANNVSVFDAIIPVKSSLNPSFVSSYFAVAIYHSGQTEFFFSLHNVRTQTCAKIEMDLCPGSVLIRPCCWWLNTSSPLAEKHGANLIINITRHNFFCSPSVFLIEEAALFKIKLSAKA